MMDQRTKIFFLRANMKYSIVIPAYNEAPYIERTISAIRERLIAAYPDVWEIIVVDNASDDGTGEAVRALGDPSIRVIREPQKGKGKALKHGVATASGDIIAYTDADLSIDPEQLCEAIDRVARKEAEMVVGSRLSAQSQKEDREWWRTFTSSAFNLAARMILDLPVGDSQCPMKVFKKELSEQLLASSENGFFIDAEFLSRVVQAEHAILEMPVAWVEHRYPGRRSKLRMFSDGAMTPIALARIRVRSASAFRSTIPVSRNER